MPLDIPGSFGVASTLLTGAVNPVRNSSGALNHAGIILGCSPAAEQQGIISNGVNLINRFHESIVED